MTTESYNLAIKTYNKMEKGPNSFINFRNVKLSVEVGPKHRNQLNKRWRSFNWSSLNRRQGWGGSDGMDKNEGRENLLFSFDIFVSFYHRPGLTLET